MSERSTLYVVRHAKAGERRTWTDDDELRPLSTHGWRQAERIGKRLAGKGATTLYSSPYVRCMQTLEPLGERLHTAVVAEPRLREGEPFEPVLELLAEAPDGVVLCSHGDVIPAVIEALARRGMEITTPPDWRKATVWTLRRDGGDIVSAKVTSPPTDRSR